MELEDLFPPGARVLLVGAHQDDETIGAAGLLATLQGLGERTIAIAIVTDGSPANPEDATQAGFATPEDYARARMTELHDALHLLPRGAPAVAALGFRDQETSRHMIDVVRALSDTVDRFDASIIITHPFEGGHPDHDTAAFAARAVQRLRGDELRLADMTSYYWDGERVITAEFLQPSANVVTLELDERLAALKQAMLDCFTSQQGTIEYLAPGTRERYRKAPLYDFTRPPSEHIFYDMFEWGIHSEEWCALAAEALAEMKLA